MKKIITSSLISITSSFFCTTLLAATSMSSLTVKVTGYQSEQGVARIAVFHSSAAYKQDNTSGRLAFRKCAVKIHHAMAQCRFTVPYGTYAVKTYHDIDNSGMLKTGSFGIPSESYGFSNNPNNQSGSRSWSDASFVINQSKMTQTINLIHP